MRVSGSFLTALIVIYWLSMNAWFVHRQTRIAELDTYSAKVHQFLAGTPKRERWLAVYGHSGARRNKIGYFGFSNERAPGFEGTEYYSTVEGALELRALGKGAAILGPLIGGGMLRIRGQLVQDDDLLPLSLTVHVQLPAGGQILVSGERAETDADEPPRFRIRIRGGEHDLPTLDLPLRPLDLGAGFLPNLSLGGLREGETFEYTSFDPLLLRTVRTSIAVEELLTQKIDGVLVDVYVLEIDSNGTQCTARVTRDGTVLRMRFGRPLEHLSVEAMSRRAARAGFETRISTDSPPRSPNGASEREATTPSPDRTSAPPSKDEPR